MKASTFHVKPTLGSLTRMISSCKETGNGKLIAIEHAARVGKIGASEACTQNTF